MAFVDYTQFHQVFPPDVGSPYAPDLIREIEAYRKSFDGVLFIDRVLKALGVTKGTLLTGRGVITSVAYTSNQRSCLLTAWC